MHNNCYLFLSDILYNKLWESVSLYPLSKAIYLEALEPHLLNEQLPDVPPQITQEFVQHYCNQKKFMVSKLIDCTVRGQSLFPT